MKEKDRFQLIAECCDIWNKTKNTPNKIINILIKLKTENQQLKSELESLKKNAIVPKFKIGQEVWIIGFTDNKYGIYRTPIKKVVTAIIQKNDGFNYCELNEEKTFYIDLDIFATKEQAEAKLKEMKLEF